MKYQSATLPRILHVEDDPDMLRLIQNILKDDYEVISCADGRRVLDLLVETSARIVLLDINLGDYCGLDLLRRIKLNDGGIHVIMLSGLVSMDTLLTSMREGAEACICKPIPSGDEIREVLQSIEIKTERWRQTWCKIVRQKHEFSKPLPLEFVQ